MCRRRHRLLRSAGQNSRVELTSVCCRDAVLAPVKLLILIVLLYSTAFTRQMARALPCQVAFAASLKSEARDLIECTLTLELEAEINQDL